MSDKSQLRAEAARLQAVFLEAGAEPFEADLLLQADTLLDLYGEDIRARAYVTDDADRGEMMLRPDFTLPVVQAHMARGAARGRYTYAGEVFRKQTVGSGRPSEYLQVGYEVFDPEAAPHVDASVFALFQRALDGLRLRPVTGDIGILLAGVETLSTTDARKAALRRHIWRPRRFRALLDRFTGLKDVPVTRRELLTAVEAQGAPALITAAGPQVGLRSADEVAARLRTLQEDAAAPPIPAPEAEALNAILEIRAPLPDAYTRLCDICVDLPGLERVVDGFAARMEALRDAGVKVETLPFEASFGRTSMEYYDGFVFGFVVPGRADIPPAATGGRYDALTRQLGEGRDCPAVGGVIRPELVHMLRREAS